jgi:DNA processing protein
MRSTRGKRLALAGRRCFASRRVHGAGGSYATARRFRTRRAPARAHHARMPHTLPIAELRAWLALSRAPDTGSARVRALVARHGGAVAACAAERVRVADACLDADLRWLEHPAHHVVTFTSVDYPPLLAHVDDAPALLYVRGDPLLAWRAQVAVVGSRNASAGGLANARAFAHALAAAGLCITSGLAAGIDGAAHEAALDAGGGTIAVCGTGLDVVYPRGHDALAARIAESGALVSEMPPGTPARPDHFPRRNRIISGLALGTLVVEANVESGSLITARLAAEQGRAVFAIPGSIHAPTARGCHRLLRQGAVLVESVADVLAELGPLARLLGTALAARIELSASCAPGVPRAAPAAGARAPRDVAPAGGDAARVLRALGHDPVGVDELVARSGLTAGVVSSILTMLKLDGVVAAQPGARYVRLSR